MADSHLLKRVQESIHRIIIGSSLKRFLDLPLPDHLLQANPLGAMSEYHAHDLFGLEGEHLFGLLLLLLPLLAPFDLHKIDIGRQSQENSQGYQKVPPPHSFFLRTQMIVPTRRIAAGAMRIETIQMKLA